VADIPRNMTAIEIAEPGAAHVLRAVQRPVPAVGRGEVLIRVAAAGVNRPDILQRTGRYAPPPGTTDIPGLEVSGEVVACGEGVTEPNKDDAVCALLAGGGYAEFAVAPAVQCLPIPDRLAVREAAALPETFFTVYHNVFERAQLRAGETLLIHGGSSGIGTTAIRLAKAFGARVIVTAGSAEKCAACVALGAERAINYRSEDFVAAVKEVTGGRGADVILDMIGAAYLARNIAAAAVEGRIALIATLGGHEAQLDLRYLFQKRLRLMASTLRPQSVEQKGRLAQVLRTQVWPLFSTHDLRPPIHAHFPLVDARRAHELMESSQHIGKILLDVQ
jgi:putative PIG3 family NAD(P)H quinone oxidoreductase